MPMILKNRLLLSLPDDLYVVDLSKVTHFMTDDHYTHVHYTSGQEFLLPFSLQKIDTLIHENYAEGNSPFLWLDKQYIVNTQRIFHISTSEQNLTLVDDKGQYFVVHTPESVQKHLFDFIEKEK